MVSFFINSLLVISEIVLYVVRWLFGKLYRGAPVFGLYSVSVVVGSTLNFRFSFKSLFSYFGSTYVKLYIFWFKFLILAFSYSLILNYWVTGLIVSIFCIILSWSFLIFDCFLQFGFMKRCSLFSKILGVGYANFIFLHKLFKSISFLGKELDVLWKSSFLVENGFNLFWFNFGRTDWSAIPRAWLGSKLALFKNEAVFCLATFWNVP